MNHPFKFNSLAIFLFTCFLFHPKQISAQEPDTLIVEWETSPGSGIPWVNHLSDVIRSDTLPNGSHISNRVYKLKAGGYYWNYNEIDCSEFHLQIIGEQSDPNSIINHPPVIQGIDTTTLGNGIISGSGDLTVKNVYFIGSDISGRELSYQPIELTGYNKRYTFDNVVFERSDFGFIGFNGFNNDLFFSNCKFRNLLADSCTQQWEGRGLSIWAEQDTIIIENCTFFNIGFTPFQLESEIVKYFRFNHNTLINVGRQMAVSGHNWHEAYFANNLLINTFWQGEGWSDINDPNRDPEAITSGVWNIDDMPPIYGPEEGRRILFTNTAIWNDPKFYNYYADTILAQPFCNPITTEYLNTYECMIAMDTIWLATKPNIVTYFSESFIDSMIQNIKDLRAGVTPAQSYFWMLPIQDGDICYTCPSWPIPENFTYDDTFLLTSGTDDLPLGDLNWFPAQKNIFEEHKQQYIAELENLSCQNPPPIPYGSFEAEDAELTGEATIEEFEGFAYIQMDSGGFFEWTFDLQESMPYELNVWTNMLGNIIRGQRILVNGVSIHECFGWSEYIWDSEYDVTDPCINPNIGMPINEWTWTEIIQDEILEADVLTLPAGQNTIRIECSWGYQNFAGIDIEPAGTNNPVLQLRAPDLTDFEIVRLNGDGPWTPSNLKYVALNSNGNITWWIESPDYMTLAIIIYYQNFGTFQTAEVTVDGTEIFNISLPNAIDSTGLSFLTPAFQFPAGWHSITLSGSHINVDFIQLVPVVSVLDENKIPLTFKIEQNYPNPFNPTTTITFDIPKTAFVSLRVFDILGREVSTLINEELTPGNYRSTFNGNGLASGIYFYKIQAGSFTETKKFILLK